MSFEWDEAKNRANRKKHDITFETAALIFDAPRALTLDGTSTAGERGTSHGGRGVRANL